MAKNEEFAKCLKFIFLRLDGELETLILADLKQLQLDDIPNLEICNKEHFIWQSIKNLNLIFLIL